MRCPAFDQVTTMSKFLCLGMPLGDVIKCSTINAAFALKRPELGTLKPGAAGDATILDTTTPLSFVCYWVIPFSLLGLAALASRIRCGLRSRYRHRESAAE